jgi:hypothetical protein
LNSLSVDMQRAPIADTPCMFTADGTFSCIGVAATAPVPAAREPFLQPATISQKALALSQSEKFALPETTITGRPLTSPLLSGWK